MSEFSPAVQEQKKRVFISASSPDLNGVRQVILEALWESGCDPVIIAEPPRYWRTADKLLRDTLSQCDTFIHIAGMAYGGEPELPTKPAGEPRQSFGQMEHRIAQELALDPRSPLQDLRVLIAPEDFPFDPLPKAEPDIVQDLQAQHRQALQGSDEEGPRPQILPYTSEEISALIRSWFFEAPLPDCAIKIEEKAPAPKAARSPLKTLEGVLAILVGLGVIGWGAMKLTGSKDAAAAAVPTVAAVPADQLVPAYVERFRIWRMLLPTLTNVEIAQLTNRDLAAKFSVSSADIDQSITIGVAPQTATGTPLPTRMPALFVLGRYQSLDELSRLQQASLDAAGWQTAGDAAVALNDDKPMTTYQDRAIQCYEKAAAAFKDSSVENWAECQRYQAAMIFIQGRPAEARSLLEQTLTVQKEKKSTSVAYSLLLLAQTLTDIDQPLINSSVEEAQSLLQGQDSAQKAALVLCPAIRSLAANDPEALLRAEQDYRDTLPKLKELFGSEHSVLGLVYLKLAGCLSAPSIYSSAAKDESALGRFSEVVQKDRIAEAERLLNESLALTERSRGVSHPLLTNPLAQLGVFMAQQQRLPEAEPYFQRRLSISEAAFGKDHSNTQVARADLASVWRLLQKNKEAEAALQQVLKHFDSQPAVPDQAMLGVLSNLSGTLIALNRHQEALPLLRRWVTLAEKQFGQNNEALIPPLCELAHTAHLTYGFGEGEQAGKRAVQLCFRYNYLSTNPHPLTIVALRSYKTNSLRNGQSEEKARALVTSLAFDTGLAAEKSDPWIRQVFERE